MANHLKRNATEVTAARRKSVCAETAAGSPARAQLRLPGRSARSISRPVAGDATNRRALRSTRNRPIGRPPRRAGGAPESAGVSGCACQIARLSDVTYVDGIPEFFASKFFPEERGLLHYVKNERGEDHDNVVTSGNFAPKKLNLHARRRSAAALPRAAAALPGGRRRPRYPVEAGAIMPPDAEMTDETGNQITSAAALAAELRAPRPAMRLVGGASVAGGPRSFGLAGSGSGATRRNPAGLPVAGAGRHPAAGVPHRASAPALSQSESRGLESVGRGAGRSDAVGRMGCAAG